MYDLILRDATIVSSRGREVADVAIQGGQIAYVGPRPPKRRAKLEISAIGKFLMPGVIDTAVQFDPNGEPSIWERESRAAVTGGVTTVLALPQGDHPVVDLASARVRASRAAGKSWCHYALWGLANGENGDELDAAVEEGLLLGRLAWLDDGGGPDTVPTRTLASLLSRKGVLGLQLDGILDGNGGVGHVLDAVRSAQRGVHLVHLSTAEELALLDPVRGDSAVTAGVTPHHLFLSDELAPETEDAPRIHTRPPVRAEHDRKTLWTAVKRGRLDCIASDHHPSLPMNGHTEGVPGSELLFPLMLSAVKYGRLSLEMLVSLCSEAPARIFGLEKKGRIERGFDADLILFAEGEVARVEQATLLSGAGWSPYAEREAAPKPDLVIVDGEIVAQRGKLVAAEPKGRLVSH